MNRPLLVAVLMAVAFLLGIPQEGVADYLCRTSKNGAASAYCASETFVTQHFPKSSTAGHIATFADGSGQQLQDGGAVPTGTVTEQKNVAGAGLATSGNCDNTSTNASNPCVYGLALTNATLQASPTNPTGTTSASVVMMGLGSTCKLTPTYSGRVHLEFSFNMFDGTAGASVSAIMKYGTGTAPTNGAAVTGTSLGTSKQTVGISGVPNAFAIASPHGNITGLTPGTAYWFDIGLSTSGGSTGSISNVDCEAFEY